MNSSPKSFAPAALIATLLVTVITSAQDAAPGLRAGAGPQGGLVAASPGDAPAILGGDGVPDILVSGGANVPVRVLSGATGAELGAGFPFGAFGGGARMAAGDLNNDGVPDIVAGQGPGGGFVTLFDGNTIANLGGGLPFGPFGGGVFVAVGDLNGDGRNDIGVSQGQGGGTVRVFNGIDYSLLLNLAPFGPGYSGGVTIAMGDLNGDSRADLIVGQQTGALVSIIDGASQGTIVSGGPFGGAFSGGVSVAAGDVNGDGRGDIILAPMSGGGGVVVYDLQTVSQIGAFAPYGAGFSAGVRVAAADITGDGRADIITGPGPNDASDVRVFSGATFAQVLAAPAYGAGLGGGVFVAAPARAPGILITSGAATTFTVGQAGSFTVTTVGTPPVTSITRSGALPAGVTFTDNGNGTATLAGTPTASGTFALTFTAANGVSTPATQNFTLTVQQAPAITSAAATTFSVFGPGSFTVTATGFPVPTLSSTGALPAGVTFTPNANGTATLAGTPASGTNGTYPLTITASNGVGAPATQAFVLTVDSSPVFTSAATTTFFVGQAGNFTVTTTASPAVTSITQTGTRPTGVTFTYNGNGTATFAGTPAGGTGGIYPLTLTATNGVGAPAVQNFTFVVDQPPDAINDSYANGVGNTQYVVGAAAPGTPAVVVAGTVIGNDIGTSLPLTAGPAVIASTQGGQVVLSANGAFIYTPPVNVTGVSDTFTYTLTDAQARTDTAVVTINLSGLVWYVGQSVTNGDGRSHSPFNSLANAQAGTTAGQTIYVASGPVAGSATLRANEVIRGAGAAFSLNGLNLPATTSPVLNGTLTLANGVNVEGVAVNGGAGPAIVGSGISTTATLNATSVVGGATGVLINGGTGALNLGVAITLAGGRAVDVQNRTAGTVTFSGPITDASGTGTGILLNANTGSTIAFAGGMALSTGPNHAFTVTGGGTVTATQNNTTIVNTLATTDGVALRVENTEIGAAGLNFRSISAGTENESAGIGIVLDNTGVAVTNGGLTVTGAGVAQSGGRIRRKRGTNGDVTQGVGIYMSNTRNPSLSWMEFVDMNNSAIVARNVAGFLFQNSRISGAGDAVGVNEGPIMFGVPGSVNGLQTGTTAIIRDSIITGGFEHNVAYYGQSGTATLLIERTTPTPGDCEIGANSSTTGADGLLVQLEGSAVATVNIQQCRFRYNRSAGFRGTVSTGPLGTANMNVTVNGAEFAGNAESNNGIVLSNAGDADLTATITNTGISGFPGAAVLVGQAIGNASANSLLRATITGNQINSPLAPNSTGIVGRFSSTIGQVSEARLLISDNGAPDHGGIIQNGLQPVIQILTPDVGTTPNANVTILNNHVDMSQSPPGSGIYGPWGIDVQATRGSLCANIVNNISHGYQPVTSDGGIRISQAQVLPEAAAAFVLAPGTQTPGDPALTVLQGNNPYPGMTYSAIGTFTTSGTCQVP